MEEQAKQVYSCEENSVCEEGKLLQSEKDFEEWAEAWRVDTFTDTMSDEDLEEFNSLKRKIVNEFRRKNAVLDEDSNIKYRLYKPLKNPSGNITFEEITLKIPTARNWESMDNAGQNKTMKKMFIFYADVLNIVPATLKKLSGVDLRFIQSVYSFFLAS